jgi:hypothetical protein
MWLDFIPIEKSCFPYLKKQGVSAVLDLRYDSARENQQDLWKALLLILREMLIEPGKWSFSFAGTLADNQNLSLLNFLSGHQFDVVFGMSEFWKPIKDAPMPCTEISFVCSVELLEKFLEVTSLDFAWDFRLGGWLVNAEDIPSILKEWKFRGEFYCPFPLVKLGYCASEDWDCIQFFSTDTKLFENLMANHRLASLITK